MQALMVGSEKRLRQVEVVSWEGRKWRKRSRLYRVDCVLEVSTIGGMTVGQASDRKGAEKGGREITIERERE